MSVEHKKKENRSETGFMTSLADYLDVSVTRERGVMGSSPQRYEREDIYMVSPLTPAMQGEWPLPRFLLCGGYSDNLIFSYTW